MLSVAHSFPLSFHPSPLTRRDPHSREQYSHLRRLARKGEGGLPQKENGGKFFRTMVCNANAIFKAILGNWVMGGRPYGVLKRCTVCVHSELSGWTETMEQKVRKPVLSLLSSTLPPPREEATEPGGGAGCYRLLQGVDKTGLWVPLVTPS